MTSHNVSCRLFVSDCKRETGCLWSGFVFVPVYGYERYTDCPRPPGVLGVGPGAPPGSGWDCDQRYVRCQSLNFCKYHTSFYNGFVHFSAPVVVAVQVNGSGYASDIFRDIVASFDILQKGNITVLSRKCLVKPLEPDYMRNMFIGTVRVKTCVCRVTQMVHVFICCFVVTPYGQDWNGKSKDLNIVVFTFLQSIFKSH